MSGPTFRFNQLKANQPSRFNAFLDQLRPSDQPALHFLHILLPHQPWKYLPSGVQYSYPKISFGYDRKVGWTTQPAPVQLGQQRHLLQLAYTDRLVGEVKRFYDEPGQPTEVDGPRNWPWPSAGSPTGSPGPRTAWPGSSRWGRTPTWSAASPWP
jgi:hypothetical protein